jgi:hypothetical protein
MKNSFTLRWPCKLGKEWLRYKGEVSQREALARASNRRFKSSAAPPKPERS